MPIYPSKQLPESPIAHKYLDNLRGVEIGGSLHNGFGLNVINVDYCDPPHGNGSKAFVGADLPVHIIAPGDDLPFKDKTFDFVINSHVIEHLFDPIAALKEWHRVAREYILIIAPHKDRCNDKDREVTKIRELWDRHVGRATKSEIGDRTVDGHHNVWNTTAFKQLCEFLNYNIVEYQDVDDKVGNGFLFLLKV